MTLGSFLVFASYVAMLQAPVRLLVGVLPFAQQARAGAVRVLELLESTPGVTDAPGATDLGPVEGVVEFDGVSFGYRRSAPVLDGFTLRVHAGETVALVGRPGCGKSTVGLLLPRFYDVQAGAVRVDGTDVRDVTTESLRTKVGVVFEDTFLFSDTVAANIAFGRPDATDEEVRAAARAAEADGFIEELPEGYATVVGERGLTLSGGQRQRIAIARALLTDPSVLVLDDATSSVDVLIEREIHATLRRLLAGRTAVLIAHRQSTIELADRVCVIDNGRVVDSGSHDELLERCTLYRRLMAGAGDAETLTPDTVAPEGDNEPQVDGVTPSAWPASGELGAATALG